MQASHSVEVVNAAKVARPHSINKGRVETRPCV
jgi:hypothetical protein